MHLSLPLFHLICAHLHLMGFFVVLLLGEVLLDLSEIEEFGRKFECERQFLLQFTPVLLKIFSVSIFELNNLILVVFLSFLQNVVPMRVKFLILFDMSLLDFFLSLLVRKEQLLVRHVVLLLAQLHNSVLGHFSLHIVARFFTLFAVLFHCRAIKQTNGEMIRYLLVKGIDGWYDYQRVLGYKLT